MKRVVIFLMILLCLTSCTKKTDEISGFSMDAPYRIKGENLSSESQTKVTEYLKEVDCIFNAYQSDSYLSRLNHHKKLTVSADDAASQDLYHAVEQSLPYCNEWFDISIRPVTKLWDFKAEHPKLPDEKVLQDNLRFVDIQNIVLEDDFIYLENNAEIELGAVAKGYVCDKISSMLELETALIDIGGTIKAVGKDITAGIKSPNHDGILCSFTLPAGKAVATSGSYERYFTVNNTTYHHILDPKTGYPMESPYASVSVICDSALKADILSTTYFSQPDPEIPEEIDVIFVTKDNRIFVTDGMKDIKMLHTDYEVMNYGQE